MSQEPKGYIVDPKRKRPDRPPPPLPKVVTVVATQENPVKIFEVIDEPSPKSKPKTKCGMIMKLLPLKVVIFLMYGGMAALYPFFTLHMKSLGITIKETAVISFLLPVLCCMIIPFLGALAAKIGHYKWIILGLTAGHIFCHLLLLGIPAFQQSDNFGIQDIRHIEIQFPCRSRRNAIFSVEQQEFVMCDARNVTVTADALNELQIDSCWTDCPVKNVPRSEQPSVCYKNEATGGKGNYCPKWFDLENQVLKGFSFDTVLDERSSATGSRWEASQFQNDEGHLLESAHCYVGPKWEDSTEEERPNCLISCKATASFAMMCRSGLARAGSFWLTVVTYFLLRLLGLLGLLTVFLILDAVTLQMTRENGGKFSSHRLLPAIGFVVFPIVSMLGDVLTDDAHRYDRESNPWDFYPAFFIFGGLNAIAALVVLCMSLPSSSPRLPVWRNVGKVLRSPQAIAVILVMLLIGVALGYFASFLFWFLEADLFMRKIVMGAGVALAFLLAIPLFALIAPRLISLIGYGNLLVIVLLSTGFRFLAYSYLYDVNLFLPIEILTAISIAIIFVVPPHFSRLMAPGYVLTLQSIITAATFGIGMSVSSVYSPQFKACQCEMKTFSGFGLGPLIGGHTISTHGHRVSMRIFAVVYLSIAVVYFLLHLFWLRKTKPIPAPVEAVQVVSSGPRPTLLQLQAAQAASSARSSDYFPDETEILYREKASPIAELDDAFVDPIYVYGSRPVSELVVVYR
ncbi:hypothetical protein BV898_01652 [Hypsibius exemplaris]|uniref:Major facilitator superfamily associated domain-containing protein n=1 Tax=Hypsibius exemplaris TaxID=2072580 RepID=A0A1W0XBA5_HYPEX|nr:hypothetical protein BV898_01652 [Hypsibius exemplaris]